MRVNSSNMSTRNKQWNRERIRRDIFLSFAEVIKSYDRSLNSKKLSMIIKNRFYSRVYRYYSISEEEEKSIKLTAEFLASSLKTTIAVLIPKSILTIIDTFIPGSSVLGIVAGSILGFLVKEKIVAVKEYKIKQKKLADFLKKYSCNEYKDIDEFINKISRELLEEPKSPLISLKKAIIALVKKSVHKTIGAFDYIVDKSGKLIKTIKGKSDKMIENVKDKTKDTFDYIKGLLKKKPKEEEQDTTNKKVVNQVANFKPKRLKRKKKKKSKKK